MWGLMVQNTIYNKIYSYSVKFLSETNILSCLSKSNKKSIISVRQNRENIVITYVIVEAIIAFPNISLATFGTSETTSLENTTIDGYTVRKSNLIANYKLNQYNNTSYFFLSL